MKILKRFSRVMMCALAALAVSCSSDSPEPVPEPTPGPNKPGNVVNPDAPVNGAMKSADLQGFVTDTDGKPLEGVSVVSGTHSTVTNAIGSFSLEQADVNDQRSIVTFSKDGYFKVVRSVDFNRSEDWHVALCAKNKGGLSVAKEFVSSNAQELSVGGLVNRLPADGYINRQTGEKFTGKVKAEMVYLNPNDDTFAEMMPGGDLAAVNAENERVRLVSYGMTAVNLTDDQGTSLQLAEGKEATLTFPIPEGMEADAPDEMPLWSFNESTGLWEQEGMAVKKGDHYEGNVKHFSWVNLDYPEREATVVGRVTNTRGESVANQMVRVGQVNTRTDAEGNYRQQVPANVGFRVSVESIYYGNYSPVVSVDVAPLQPQTSRTVNLVLPCLNQISGRVVRGSEGISAIVWYEINGGTTMPTRTDKNGYFSFESSDNFRGQVTLHVLADDGQKKSFEVTLNGASQDLGTMQMGENQGVSGAMSPSEAKSYIEETARQVIALFNPDDQADVIRLAGYFDRNYGDYDAPVEWENSVGAKAPARFFRGMARGLANNDYNALTRAAEELTIVAFTGEYTPDASLERWVKTGNSTDVVMSFPYNGSTCTLRITPSGSSWTVSDEVATVKVKVPERIDFSLKVGSKSYASGYVESKYNAVGHTMKLNVSAEVANITAKLSSNGTDSKLEATTSATVGEKTLVSGSATVTGSNMLNPTYLKQLYTKQSDEWEEWMELDLTVARKMFKTGNATAKILGRMEFKGSSRDIPGIIDMDEAYFDSYDYDDKEEARKLCQQWCDRVNTLIDTGVYLGGSNVSSAKVICSPKLEEENYGGWSWWEWYPEQLLQFSQDGSSYSFDDYFSGSGLGSMESQLKSLLKQYYLLYDPEAEID